MNGPNIRPAATTAEHRSGQAAPTRIVPDVTVVIPTLGRPILEKCLDSIRLGSCLPAAIIVVDQGGSDDIDRWLDQLGQEGVVTRHDRMDGAGRAAGLNRGLKQVATPFALVTDDDCEVDVEWVRKMADRLRQEPGIAVTGAVLPGGSEPVLSTVRDTRSSTAWRPRLTYDRLSGGNCGFSRHVLEKVGLFDEDPCMRFAEDGEWAYRALRRGIGIAYEPAARVTHHGWRASGERLDQYRGYARTHAAFFGKYLRRGDMFIAARAIVHVGRALVRWIRGLLHRDRELAANGRAYVTQFIPGAVEGFRSRVRPPALQ